LYNGEHENYLPREEPARLRRERRVVERRKKKEMSRRIEAIFMRQSGDASHALLPAKYMAMLHLTTK
jgi:hypothetical protein